MDKQQALEKLRKVMELLNEEQVVALVGIAIALLPKPNDGQNEDLDAE